MDKQEIINEYLLGKAGSMQDIKKNALYINKAVNECFKWFRGALKKLATEGFDILILMVQRKCITG